MDCVANLLVDCKTYNQEIVELGKELRVCRNLEHKIVTAGNQAKLIQDITNKLQANSAAEEPWGIEIKAEIEHFDLPDTTPKPVNASL
jgi:hypothetical protein